MGVEARWLTARVAADNAAREATVDTLLPLLVDQVHPTPDTDVRLIDVGAGSGANQRWLAPRLPFRQRWVHLDHDPAILGHTHAVGDTEFVVGGIGVLGDLLGGRPGPSVITCAAVLDVLTRADVGVLCDLVTAHQVPALLSLSVTGALSINPPHAADQDLLAAFNAHQRRAGRAGPDAPGIVAEKCADAGVRLEEAGTPWKLDSTDDESFVARFLGERVQAAVEHDPDLAASGAQWLADRLAQLSGSALRIIVGHVDLLLVP